MGKNKKKTITKKVNDSDPEALKVRQTSPKLINLRIYIRAAAKITQYIAHVSSNFYVIIGKKPKLHSRVCVSEKINQLMAIFFQKLSFKLTNIVN